MRKRILAGVLVAGALALGVVAQAADPDTTWREAVRVAYATNGSILATGKILVGGADNIAHAVTPSGDLTVNTNGLVSVTNALNVEVGAGKILIGNPAGLLRAQSLSGDATMNSNGVVTAAGVTTNRTFVSATGVTNTLCITNGLIKAIQ